MKTLGSFSQRIADRRLLKGVGFWAAIDRLKLSQPGVHVRIRRLRHGSRNMIGISADLRSRHTYDDCMMQRDVNIRVVCVADDILHLFRLRDTLFVCSAVGMV